MQKKKKNLTNLYIKTISTTYCPFFLPFFLCHIFICQLQLIRSLIFIKKKNKALPNTIKFFFLNRERVLEKIIVELEKIEIIYKER